MPTAADRLTPESSPEAVQSGISACISQMADEHPDWENDRRVAACHSMARKATGKALRPKGEGGKTSRRIEGT